jgi:hypothetical protein
MFRRTRRPLVAVAAASMLALGVTAAPASAQTTQEGLVNVSLTDTNVQVPVAVAAAVCGVQANVIATNNFGGNALCDATSRSTANNGGGGGGNTKQSGLVNVSLTDTNVQIPIGIAADVCGVQANVIAAGDFGGNAVCNSIARPSAQN